MANTRTFSTASAATAATAVSAAATTTARNTLSPNRHRLRAVDRDEVAGLAEVADFLPPGATWLPAPQHTLPALPGRPPMVGYLVLVPADQQPALAGAVASAQHRAFVPEPAPDVPAGGPVQIDSTRRTAAVDGVTLDLTYLEFELLAHLVAHPHRVHTRDQLVTTVWGYGHVGDGRTVDVHVARLRRKLGAEHRRSIQTVRRVGYKYAP
ncbi:MULTISPECIES: winged helix-turn-helix domain-containing protein [Streptomyces]|uniref:Winged helix-turn-helix domain-containing protein n=1 Tax=Streptomyces glycanivorans TaxID=3033808 RepID=A0ABY9JK93_9ACTN|nr:MULTISPECIES: winged helix-turn-helix domain-containing protein [unclassified Streptomyces]WSQ80362.1 winged helix-turn-helix domain-containing protein [Streptomyces sp. NBC_01213]TXS08603.1 winged helix family transcriptional regulator [Streptomyces sp. wa22]WLQ66943.1 winged helix-turn-helix domain-containing protein [Streptomyces sp. Alt3]WSQ87696.1 winged helix-turn-helix domain-containing protein [Streptomyces sp. NBC_01212]WSR06296.1 winged helix-turn-helix domain-containing protein [